MTPARTRPSSWFAGRAQTFLLRSAFAALLILIFAPTERATALVHFSGVSYQQPSEPSHANHSLSQQLVKKSREAAGEDDQDQFRHSWSVQKLSQYTRLSIEHAYWLSIFLNSLGWVFW